jgi:hypothetical protein
LICSNTGLFVLQRTEEIKLDKNTIVVLWQNNGTAYGYKNVNGKYYGFNAGMQGTKTRVWWWHVPFFIPIQMEL